MGLAIILVVLCHRKHVKLGDQNSEGWKDTHVQRDYLIFTQLNWQTNKGRHWLKGEWASRG